MSRIEITETCACGASFTASGDYPNVGFQQDAFHRAHKLCMERSQLTQSEHSDKDVQPTKDVAVVEVAAPQEPTAPTVCPKCGGGKDDWRYGCTNPFHGQER